MKRYASTLLLLPALLFVLCTQPATIQRAEAGRTPSKAYLLADFEKKADVGKVVAEGFAVSRVPGDTKAEGHLLRAVGQDDAEAYALHFEKVPRDVRGYESVSFRMRGLVDRGPGLDLGFQDAKGGRMHATLSSPGASWVDVSLLLSDMDAGELFNPAKVARFSILSDGAGAFEIDDLRLHKGHGNWRTDGAILLRAFGEDRVAKVAYVRTKHFHIYTDSNGARRKFPKALEETYDFVLEALGVPEMTSRLPVYIFQSKDLYTDFCVRYAGWTPQAGKASAGHACSRYFATYYQAPKSPVVTHELTHAIFHRTVGTGGGSWFQEGVAVYVEELSQGKSAAKLFAPKVRGESYAPLAEFIEIPRLIGSSDSRGGAFTSGSLYAQAGALFEFLLRGPLFQEEGTQGLPAVVLALARVSRSGGSERIEKILGCTIAELDTAWQAWGSRPPKR